MANSMELLLHFIIGTIF